MKRVPETSDNLAEEVIDSVLPSDEDLSTAESFELMTYSGLMGPDPYGPQTTFFVLGSYEEPFKYRLDGVTDRLNRSRPSGYAFIQATQPDLNLPGRLAPIKLKFYMLAFASDHLVLVIEHNAGGDLPELDRLASPDLIDRAYAFARTGNRRFAPAKSEKESRRLAIAAAYSSGSDAALRVALREIINDGNIPDVSDDDLYDWLEEELGGRAPISYSGVVDDLFGLLDGRDRLYGWDLEEYLYMEVSQELPH